MTVSNQEGLVEFTLRNFVFFAWLGCGYRFTFRFLSTAESLQKKKKSERSNFTFILCLDYVSWEYNNC